MSIDFTQLLLTKTSDQQALLDALVNGGCTVLKPNSIKCGYHGETNPSAGVYRDDKGGWRYKCHGCGMNEDWFGIVAENTGLGRTEIIKQYTMNQADTTTPTKPKQEKEEKTWDSPRDIYEWLAAKVEKVLIYRYINPATKLDDLVVFRCEPALGGKSRKGFIQCSPRGDKWVMKGPEGKLPLFNQIGIASANNVVVVEGEKAAQALIDIGIVATTAPGGAGKDAADVDWSPLQGKPVYLWPDNDAKGVEHMDKVAAALEHIAQSIARMQAGVFGLPEKGDAYDLIAQLRAEGCDDALIRKTIIAELVDNKPASPADEVEQFIEDQISGKYRAVSWEWDVLSGSTKALLPGTVTVICGDPNDGKSFLLLQAANHWIHSERAKVAIYELEDDKKYHLMRSLAQTAGNSKLLDDRWIEANPDDAREAFAMHVKSIDSLGRAMWDSPDSVVKLSDLTQWVRERCEEGCRVIGIDPITATSTGDNRFQDDLDFVITIKILARQYEVSIVLITHPKKGRKASYGLDELAGGAAYSRFTHTVIWIKRWAKAQEGTIQRYNMMRICEKVKVSYNRSIYLSKVRNGPGAGLELAYNFDPNTLRFIEEGIVDQDAKKEGAA